MTHPTQGARSQARFCAPCASSAARAPCGEAPRQLAAATDCDKRPSSSWLLRVWLPPGGGSDLLRGGCCGAGDGRVRRRGADALWPRSCGAGSNLTLVPARCGSVAQEKNAVYIVTDVWADCPTLSVAIKVITCVAVLAFAQGSIAVKLVPVPRRARIPPLQLFGAQHAVRWIRCRALERHWAAGI
jgi:hypothetical protein